jgi:hypothetical protein
MLWRSYKNKNNNNNNNIQEIQYLKKKKRCELIIKKKRRTSSGCWLARMLKYYFILVCFWASFRFTSLSLLTKYKY